MRTDPHYQATEGQVVVPRRPGYGLANLYRREYLRRRYVIHIQRIFEAYMRELDRLLLG